MTADARAIAPRSSILAIGERYGLIALLLLVVATFSILPASSPTFLTTANLAVVLSNQSVILLCAVAVMLPLIAGNFDFSVGSIAVVGSVVCASAQIDAGLPIAAAVALSIAVGTAIGLLNGFLVAVLQLNSFVATLGTATALGGIVQWYTGGLPLTGIDPAFVGFGAGTWFGVPQIIYFVIIAVVAVWYVLAFTPFGRSLYAVGSNRRAAVLVGLPTQRYVWTTFALSGLLAGIAGVLLCARLGGASPDNGTYLLFPALTAVFLGATAIRPGVFNVWGTVIGVLFVAVSVSGLTMAGADNWVDAVFNGVALVVAVFLSTYLGKRRRGSGR